MKHIISLFIVALVCVSFAKTNNGRTFPDSTNFTTEGSDTRRAWNQIDTVLTELTNLLAAARNKDAINIDSAYINSYIKGNPDVDSLTGNPFIDTVTTRGVKVGAGNIYITKIDTITSDDTLMIILNTGDSLMIGKDR